MFIVYFHSGYCQIAHFWRNRIIIHRAKYLMHGEACSVNAVTNCNSAVTFYPKTSA
jgi:hypothetical protein